MPDQSPASSDLTLLSDTFTCHEGKKLCSIALLSPRIMPCYIVSLPSIPPEQRPNAIAFALRTKYPGSPDISKTDYWIPKCIERNLRKRGGQVISYAIPEIIITYFHKKHQLIISSAALLYEVAGNIRKEAWIGILVASSWVELLQVENGMPISYTVSKELSDPEFATQYAKIAEQRKLPIVAISTNRYSADNLQIKKQIKTITGINVNLTSFSDSCKTKINHNREIFNQKSEKKNKLKRFILPLLILLNLYAIHYTTSVLATNTHKKTLLIKKTYLQQKEIVESYNRMIQDTKHSELQENEHCTAIPVYLIISDIVNCLHEGWIRSLVIQENSFQLDAEGAEALAVVNSLDKKSRFSQIKLHKAVPSTIRKEKFSISGEIVND